MTFHLDLRSPIRILDAQSMPILRAQYASGISACLSLTQILLKSLTCFFTGSSESWIKLLIRRFPNSLTMHLKIDNKYPC